MITKQKQIIVPSYLTGEIRKYLLKDEDVLFGVNTTNFISLFTKENEYRLSDEGSLTAVFKTFRIISNDLKVFNNSAKTVNFSKELLSFYRELIYYGIDIEKLPEDNNEDKEIKKLIKIIDDLNLPFKKDKADYDLKFKDAKDYEVVIDFNGSFMEYYLASKWINNGAKRINLFKKNKPKLTYKKASVRIKEIKGLKDYLLETQDKYAPSDIQIIINNDLYAYDLDRIFNKYDIPLYYPYRREISKSANKLLKLVNYLKNPDQNNLLELIRSNIFSYDTEYLDDYISIFGLGLDDCFNGFEHIKNLKLKIVGNIDYENLLRLEEFAEKERRKIEKELDLLKDISNPLEIIVKFYNLLFDKNDFDNKEELESFKRLRFLIIDLCKNEAPLDIFDYCLRSFDRDISENEYEAIEVTDMNHIKPNKKLSIVLGATQNDFLPSVDKNGAINEKYLSRVKGYPSLEERLAFEKEKLDILVNNTTEELIISYAYSELDGSANELSVLIEERFNINQKDMNEWEVAEEEHYYLMDHKLDEDIVKDLFVVDDKYIRGSVSSLETYTTCPYRYFVEKGLMVNNKQGYFDIDAAILGSIRHKIFEDAGKKGFKESVDDFDLIVEENFKDLYDVFPNRKNEIDLKKKIIKEVLRLHLFKAIKLEASGLFKSSKYEEPYNDIYPSKPYQLKLNGIIDRIDETSNYYRIIDYKSSAHSFDYKKFLKGELIQLMMYAWASKQMLKDKDPFGIYYFMLNAKEFSDEALFDQDDMTKLETFFTRNKLVGWSFDQTEEELLNQKELIDSKVTKTLLKEDPEYASYERMMEVLNEVINKIIERIISGDIMTNPSDDNCRFCALSPICHRILVSEEDEVSEVN